MYRRAILTTLLAVAAWNVLAACPTPPPRVTGVPRPGVTVEVGQRDVSAGERGFREVYLTVLPQDLALVREQRDATLPGGLAAVSYLDVVDSIIPESTRVRFYPEDGDPEDVQFLEQRYRYDLIAPARIMELALGGTIRVKWTQPRTGQERTMEGVVESTAEGLFLRTPDGTYTLATPAGEGWYYRTILDELPGALFSRPLLDWIIETREGGSGVLETSYLAHGFSWEADYVVTANEDFSKADVLGWVTLRNQTGHRFEQAHLAVVAGQVNIAAEAYNGYAMGGMGLMAAEGDGDGDYAYQEEGLFEYHLYKLDEPATLPAYSWKQVSFIDRPDIPITTKYRANIRLQPSNYGSPVGTDDAVPANVVRLLTIENKADVDGLGIPLPAGTARVYARSGEDLFFIDATQVEDTPREEPMEVSAGGAPFLVVKTTVTDYETSDAGAFGSYDIVTHEIEAVNRGSHAVRVLFHMALPGAGYPYGYPGAYGYDARLERPRGDSGPPIEEVETGVWEMERTLEPDEQVEDTLVLRIHQRY